MGAIRPPRRVLLFVGMLSGDVDLLARAKQHLRRTFGEIDIASDVWSFEGTTYYEAEMGPDLHRQFVLMADPVRPERLPEIKRETNRLEDAIAEETASEPLRPVNLDPGYLSLSKVVLATTKDYSHRLYLDQGIYGEVTLHYESGAWRAWPWTYPDYAGPTYHPFFEAAREKLKQTLNESESPGRPE